MTRYIAWLALSAALAAPAALAQQAAPRKLAHDPFDRSALQRLLNEPSPSPAPGAPAATGAVAAAPAVPPPPPGARLAQLELRAVMVGSRRPLVNLGGTILGIGESVEGLRLVEVRERSALFASDGRVIELVLGARQEP